VAWGYWEVVGAPAGPRGFTIRRIRATLDPTVDDEAVNADGLTDIGIRVAEGYSIAAPPTPMGSAARTSIPVDRPVGTSPGVTQDVQGLDLDVFVPSGQKLQVGIQTDAAGLGSRVVITLDVEHHG
jgi:hypothetical protein